MDSRIEKTGLTLVEILVVVGIIAILVGMVAGLAGRLQDRADKGRLEQTFLLLEAALEQFDDYGFVWRNHDYASLRFPPDCRGFDLAGLEAELATVLARDVSIAGGTAYYDPNYSSSAVLYLFLQRVPPCRGILERFDASVFDNPMTDMRISIGPSGAEDILPLTVFVDPWENPIEYDYFERNSDGTPDIDTRRMFPVLRSAGPDGLFDTADDITSDSLQRQAMQP